MKYTRSISVYEKSEVAQLRTDIVSFADKYGIQETSNAYGISRRTLFRWKKNLKDSGKKLHTLIPEPKKPRTLRNMTTHPKVISFICDMKEECSNLGKEKIKPLLDEYCK